MQRWNREHVSITLQSKGQALAIIGSGGSTIRELQSSTGARIDVDPNTLRVMLSGKEDTVKAAKSRVMDIIGHTGLRERDGNKGYKGDGRGKGNYGFADGGGHP